MIINIITSDYSFIKAHELIEGRIENSRVKIAEFERDFHSVELATVNEPTHDYYRLMAASEFKKIIDDDEKQFLVQCEVYASEHPDDIPTQAAKDADWALHKQQRLQEVNDLYESEFFQAATVYKQDSIAIRLTFVKR